jgi:hypothetical protein
MFLGLQDPDPDRTVRGMDSDPAPGIRILLSSCKNSKKNLDSFYFVTLDFLSLKNDGNVPSKSTVISRKNCVKNNFFAGMLKVNDENSRIRIQDPDPLVRSMDPRIRIHPKMSWIRNTGICSDFLIT